MICMWIIHEEVCASRQLLLRALLGKVNSLCYNSFIRPNICFNFAGAVARARQSPAIITNTFDVQQSTVRGTAVYFHTHRNVQRRRNLAHACMHECCAPGVQTKVNIAAAAPRIFHITYGGGKTTGGIYCWMSMNDSRSEYKVSDTPHNGFGKQKGTQSCAWKHKFPIDFE